MDKSGRLPAMLRARLSGRGPMLLLLVLVILGLAAHALEWWDWHQVLQWARGHARQGWLVAALILLQILLFMLGLPGSTLLWVVAGLYPPSAATPILLVGAVGGGLAAYWFARRLSTAQRARLDGNRLFRLLQERGDFLTLCALRILPGFPHSVTNYGAGVLRLPLGRFLAASVLGFGIKLYLYSSVIHHALAGPESAQPAWIETAALLLLLALLLLAAGLFMRRRKEISGR